MGWIADKIGCFQSTSLVIVIFLRLLKTNKRLDSLTLAAIHICADEPHDFMNTTHMNLEEAVKAFEDVEANIGLSSNWGGSS